MRSYFFALVAAAALSISLVAHAATLASDTAGPNVTGVSAYSGQSFTVAGTGTYDDITFNFYTSALAPYATGTGFLFSSAYSGTPNALSSSDPGYLGSASSSGGAYSFASSLDLTAGTQYFFYENGLIAAGAISGGAPLAGQGDAFALSATGDFLNTSQGGTNFLVTGSAATPEPSTFALLGTGLLGFAGVLRRRLA